MDLEQHALLAFAALGILALRLCPFLQRVFVRHHQQDSVRVLVIVQDTLIDVDTAVRQRVLKALRAVFLAVRADKQRLEAPNDPEESRVRFRHVTHIARVQPSVDDGRCRALGVLPITRHDVLSLDDDLAAFTVRHDITFRVADLQLHRLDNPSRRTEDGAVERVGADDRSRLTQTVTLEHRHAYRAEIALQRDVKQRSAAYEELHSSAEILPYRLENQAIEELHQRPSPRVLPSAFIPVLAVICDRVLEREVI